MKVYKANGGWVKQFDNGQVAGPFGSKSEADSAKEVVVVSQKIKQQEQKAEVKSEKPWGSYKKDN
jgi:hypothetical protein